MSLHTVVERIVSMINFTVLNKQCSQYSAVHHYCQQIPKDKSVMFFCWTKLVAKKIMCRIAVKSPGLSSSRSSIVTLCVYPLNTPPQKVVCCFWTMLFLFNFSSSIWTRVHVQLFSDHICTHVHNNATHFQFRPVMDSIWIVMDGGCPTVVVVILRQLAKVVLLWQHGCGGITAAVG